MKKYINLTSVLFFGLLLFQCGKADDDGGGSQPPTPEPVQITITASDFSVTIAENPADNAVLGTVQANASSGSVSFAITSQSVAGAIVINASTGELTVANASLFDFETQSTLTAVVRASSGGSTDDATITITLTDVDENTASSRTLWEGAIITFSKPNGGDPNDEANQDRITDRVWITRGNQGQIYNIVSENVASNSTSPAGTAWAQGTYAIIDDLTFTSFRDAAPGQKPKNAVSIPMVLHLVEDDVYIEIKITSWAQGKQGGFAYERRTAE